MDKAIEEWFTIPRSKVISKFAELPGARIVGDPACVYVPGHRDDRVLLIAHADTVFADPIKLTINEGVIRSAIPNNGIGADDRAGCYMVWLFRELGHTILITDEEELGCLGSKSLAQNAVFEEINRHSFAIQFDRKGSSDLVFYDVGTSQFEEWIARQYSGYSKAEGTSTDICILCQSMCGVNISVGYHNAHHHSENFVYDEWYNTYTHTMNLLTKSDIPAFPRPSKIPCEY